MGKGQPRSLFHPLEALGYLWQSLAAPLLALVFAGPGIERFVRWAFWAVAVSGVWGLVMVLLGLDFLETQSSWSDPGSGLWLSPWARRWPPWCSAVSTGSRWLHSLPRVLDQREVIDEHLALPERGPSSTTVGPVSGFSREAHRGQGSLQGGAVRP
ncbi:MAG: hypothetical protein ACRDIZ_02275 [Actinomycetota bacterium]